MRRLDDWFNVDSSAAALFALATVFMLQSSRAFVSYLVFVVDQSQRANIAAAALAVFTFPVFTWLLVRFASREQVFVASVTLLAIARLGSQLIEEPVTRLMLSGVVLATWGVLTVLLANDRPRTVGTGLVLGFGLDLAFRTARGSLDLLWIPGIPETSVTVVAIALLALFGWRVRRLSSAGGGNWRLAGALLVLGPAIALFHLVTGNIAFVSTHAGLSPSGASALLAAGMIVGVLIAVLRLLAITLGAGSGALISRFILFDTIIGAVALGFAWSGEGPALLGVLFVTVTTTELIIFALSGGSFTAEPRIGPASVFTALGLLLQFVVLFVYYTSTGSGAMLAVAWLGLVAGTLIAALSLSKSLQTQPFIATTYAAPAGLVALILAGSVLWAVAAEESPKVDASGNGTLNVVTYNIQSGFSRDNYWDLEATAQVIEDSDADIIFLQEVSRGWLVTTGNDELTWLSDRLDMSYAWGPASSDDLWGNAILSRFPITSETVVKYDSTENLKRSALVVELDAGTGQPLTAISTHLDNPEEASVARGEQVEQLMDLLNPNATTILAGDFNMTPNDPLIQAIIDIGFVDVGPAVGADQGTAEDGRRIDYIFVTRYFTVLSATVIDSAASDHRPLTATVSVRQ